VLNPVSSFLTIFRYQSNRTGIWKHVRWGLFTEAIECAGQSSSVSLSPTYIPQGRNYQARDPFLIVSFLQMGHCCLRDHTGSPKPMAVELMGQSNQAQPHKMRKGWAHSQYLPQGQTKHACIDRHQLNRTGEDDHGALWIITEKSECAIHLLE